MHASPHSKFDNKDKWDKYKYQYLDIIGEHYYDTNFDEVLYLTDTDRHWDGWKTSVHDKVPQQEKWHKESLVFWEDVSDIKYILYVCKCKSLNHIL